MRRLAVLACALVLAACGDSSPSPSASPSPSPSASTSPSPSDDEAARRIEADVRFLADDLLEGREAGTRGYDLAARYVAARYAALGLEPAGDAGGWYQKVPMVRGVRESEGARFELARGGERIAFAFERDWLPAIHFGAGRFDLSAPMVFVGQAVHAPERGHDDFDGVEVSGKIAVFLGNAPAKFSNDQRAYYASSAVKLAELERRGAVGYVWITDPRDEAKRPWAQGARNWQRPGMRLLEGSTPVDDFPALVARASVRSGVAETLFAGAKHDAKTVFEQLANDALVAFDLVGTASIAARATLERVASDNVVAKRTGSDDARAGEHVVFTAHLDHVGLGAPIDGDAIHNGALDNALGVAILLEAASRFAHAPAPARSLVFVALTAEEKGLLGAEHYARNPGLAGRIVANVNMDMPILLAPLEDVIPWGVEHSSLQSVLARAAQELGFAVTPDPLPEEVVFVRSDQYPFVKQGVPAVYLGGGIRASDGSDALATMQEFLKSHYHLPSDEVELPIHYPTAARLATLNHRIGSLIAEDAEAPRWNEGDFFGDRFGKAR